MNTFRAFVVEIEPDNSYEVNIEGVISITVRDSGETDDSVVTFESALSSVVELTLSDDYEIQFVSKCDGGSCRRYVVSIDNGD
nr:MAG TPA: hypothetical protein [Caudoviricetes sp.]